MKIGQGVFELLGSKNWGLPLTWPVALTTVQHYRADCDDDQDRWVDMFLLVPAQPGSPRQRAVKRL